MAEQSKLTSIHLFGFILNELAHYNVHSDLLICKKNIFKQQRSSPFFIWHISTYFISSAALRQNNTVSHCNRQYCYHSIYLLA